jgi:hypothetical protein
MNIYRLFAGRAIAGLIVILQTGCDTSSGPVSLTMSIDPSTITLGQSATITWEWKTPVGGGFCHASGAWHGDKKARNSSVVTPTETGTLTYTLECFEDFNTMNYRSRTASVTLMVNPAADTRAAATHGMAAEYAFTTIDYPGADRTEAHDINDAGQIVGYFFDGAGPHGFVKDGDTTTAFEVGADETPALAINDEGEILGHTLDDVALFQAFKVPGAMTTQVKGINDSGSVVGWFDEGGGKVRGFLAVRVDTGSVAIDVAPDNSSNALNPESGSLVWVGLLSETATTREFDPVSQVDASTARFGPAGAEHIRYQVRDINRDGLADLLLQFRVRDAGLRCGATRASLTGATFDGRRVTGTQPIVTVGCR